eukprot:CAMPEP_0197857534 /NCGR_PEP_ID=MMETSP1438-20131217/30695_1 /TAXON_ID=1461541 /ORGANISM="Pterosperma sp., Strain CCMP1384" /LENGTH=287 /DNA_ID=CAMNT_0043473399 /DNA_START=36 /DNA_END=899 /DNA_ORIENTATION=-
MADLEERASTAEHIALLRERYITANFVPLLKQLIKGKECDLDKKTLKELNAISSKLSDTNFKDNVEQDEMPNEERLHLERRVLILAQDEVARLQEHVISSKTYANTIEREKDIQLQEMQRTYEARWKVDYQALRHANAQEARRQEEERKFLVKQMQAARRTGQSSKGVPDLNVPSFAGEDTKKTSLPDLRPQYKLDPDYDENPMASMDSMGSMGSPRDQFNMAPPPQMNQMMGGEAHYQGRRGSHIAARRPSTAPGLAPIQQGKGGGRQSNRINMGATGAGTNFLLP